ncbi:hypothetical protein HK100_005658 [Physocladia obscura]|uniref:BZIP domain-containing protein n=1 Tax=Physocladia obscura TaxID=109957 RepID=A0AAD5SRD9_9FUNG|nr:hypothetical protein HK100_005658 [Physocladia obscura]
MRAAQRALRERKQQKLHDLESEITTLKHEICQLQTQIAGLTASHHTDPPSVLITSLCTNCQIEKLRADCLSENVKKLENFVASLSHLLNTINAPTLDAYPATLTGQYQSRLMTPAIPTTANSQQFFQPKNFQSFIAANNPVLYPAGAIPLNSEDLDSLVATATFENNLFYENNLPQSNISTNAIFESDFQWLDLLPPPSNQMAQRLNSNFSRNLSASEMFGPPNLDILEKAQLIVPSLRRWSEAFDSVAEALLQYINEVVPHSILALPESELTIIASEHEMLSPKICIFKEKVSCILAIQKNSLKEINKLCSLFQLCNANQYQPTEEEDILSEVSLLEFQIKSHMTSLSDLSSYDYAISLAAEDIPFVAAYLTGRHNNNKN